jgi:hypothetical protein
MKIIAKKVSEPLQANCKFLTKICLTMYGLKPSFDPAPYKNKILDW